MNIPITGLPGIGTARTATPREIVSGNVHFAQYLPGLRTTSGGKYAPSILGVLTATAATTTTSLSVSVAVATEIVRRIGTTGTFKLTGPPAAAGAVATQSVSYSAVNTATGIITCTAISATCIAGSYIQPVDGSETPICLLGNRWGVKVTDMGGASTDVLEDQFLIAGHVKTANVVNYPTDSSLIAWLKAALRTNCPAMTFDDSF